MCKELDEFVGTYYVCKKWLPRNFLRRLTKVMQATAAQRGASVEAIAVFTRQTGSRLKETVMKRTPLGRSALSGPHLPVSE